MLRLLRYALASAGLTVLAGISSGMNLGLLSLDSVALEALSRGGNPQQRRRARTVLPIIRRRHVLLVTLLLSNAAAAEALPLCLEMILGPTEAVAVSVVLILLFGELIPQALCASYPLEIGAAFSWVVWAMMTIAWPIAWPVSKLLDSILGHTVRGQFFARSELKELIDMHETVNHSLSADEVSIIKGALDMQMKIASAIVTPLDAVFALSDTTIINTDTRRAILESGHSRIPIFSGPPPMSHSASEWSSMLLVKTLICAPDGVAIRDLPLKQLPAVPAGTPLFDLLNLFQTGRSHMVTVIQQDGECSGIITLEDVIEELIQEEIVDETDQYVDVVKKIRVGQAMQQVQHPRARGMSVCCASSAKSPDIAASV